jgi:hypothetical protein
MGALCAWIRERIVDPGLMWVHPSEPRTVPGSTRFARHVTGFVHIAGSRDGSVIESSISVEALGVS